MDAEQKGCAIITGGAGGLGLAIAAQLAADGYALALVDIDADQAAASAHDLVGRSGGVAQGFACDVSDYTSIETTVSAICDQLGPPDVLVNSAGIGPLQPVLEISPETWSQVLAVNLSGTFWFAQVVARQMTSRRYGRIVNIASISGERAGFGRSAYGTTKAAVIHLTRQLAVELAPFGITVNAVGPGPVDTQLALDHHTPEMRADYHALIPLGRYGLPEEIAAAVRFLCQQNAGYVTGQTLFVDGGFTAAGIAMNMARNYAEGVEDSAGDKPDDA